jgi:hypothetical protein
MVGVVNGLVGGSEVLLRAFCCKVRSGSGRLRHTTEGGEREEEIKVGLILGLLGVTIK